jgi:hypothetical protein
MKIFEKIQVSSKSDKKSVYFARKLFYFYVNISINSSENEKFLGTKVAEYIKTQVLCTVTFFS